MEKSIKWLVVAAAFIAASANAADPGQFRVTPYLGFANAKVEGRHLEFGETQKYEGWTAGISAGYRTSFGLVFELGTSASGEPILGWATGGELRETYGAVGYDIRFADDWHFTPKIGMTSWKLKAGELEELVDNSGQLRDSLNGEDVYLELAIAREFNSHLSMGLSYKEANVDFGSARSAAFSLSWGF
jgi:hypothetical protein